MTIMINVGGESPWKKGSGSGSGSGLVSVSGLFSGGEKGVQGGKRIG